MEDKKIEKEVIKNLLKNRWVVGKCNNITNTTSIIKATILETIRQVLLFQLKELKEKTNKIKKSVRYIDTLRL